jgi:hypothetical protein
MFLCGINVEIGVGQLHEAYAHRMNMQAFTHIGKTYSKGNIHRLQDACFTSKSMRKIYISDRFYLHGTLQNSRRWRRSRGEAGCEDAAVCW